MDLFTPKIVQHLCLLAFPPQLVITSEEILAPTGGVEGGARLFCTAVRQATLLKSTLLEIFWLKDNSDVISNTSDLAISGPTSTTATSITSTLAVSVVRASQAGVYTCVVNMTIPGVVEDHQVRETSMVYVISKCDT